VDDYVLDLRGNLGGVLDGALQIAALFLQQVLILKKKIHKEERVLKKKNVRTQNNTELWHIPPKKKLFLELARDPTTKRLRTSWTQNNTQKPLTHAKKKL